MVKLAESIKKELMNEKGTNTKKITSLHRSPKHVGIRQKA